MHAPTPRPSRGGYTPSFLILYVLKNQNSPVLSDTLNLKPPALPSSSCSSPLPSSSTSSLALSGGAFWLSLLSSSQSWSWSWLSCQVEQDDYHSHHHRGNHDWHPEKIILTHSWWRCYDYHNNHHLGHHDYSNLDLTHVVGGDVMRTTISTGELLQPGSCSSPRWSSSLFDLDIDLLDLALYPGGHLLFLIIIFIMAITTTILHFT